MFPDSAFQNNLYEEGVEEEVHPRTRKKPFWGSVAASLLLAGLSSPLDAQEIKGKIMDASGDPVQGAFVHTIPLTSLTSIGAIAETDSEGNFILSTPQNTSLLIPSYRGMNYPPETVMGGEEKTVNFSLPFDIPDDRRILARSEIKDWFVLEAEEAEGKISLYLYTRPEALRDQIHPRGSGIATLSLPEEPHDVKIFLAGKPYAPPTGQEEVIQMVVDFLGKQILTLPAAAIAPLADAALGLSLDAAQLLGKSKSVTVDLGENLTLQEGKVYVFPWRSLPALFQEKQPVRIDFSGEGEVYAHFLFNYRVKNLVPDRVAGLSVAFTLDTPEYEEVQGRKGNKTNGFQEFIIDGQGIDIYVGHADAELFRVLRGNVDHDPAEEYVLGVNTYHNGVERSGMIVIADQEGNIKRIFDSLKFFENNPDYIQGPEDFRLIQIEQGYPLAIQATMSNETPEHFHKFSYLFLVKLDGHYARLSPGLIHYQKQYAVDTGLTFSDLDGNGSLEVIWTHYDKDQRQRTEYFWVDGFLDGRLKEAWDTSQKR